MKKKRPKFLHQEHWKLSQFKKASWRKPRGKRSKMRAKERSKPFLVSIGYRGPKEVRHWHPRGMPEVTVYTVREVEQITGEVVRIASAVGTRKKIDIVRAAVEKNIPLVNPRIKFVKIATTEELESLIPLREYINAWYLSDKLTDDEREDLEEQLEEAGIEVME
jgi:large subunit ribosomal protein L32e